MDELKFDAEKRAITGKQVKQLRQQGLLPAVLYGRDMESIPIALDMRLASKTLASTTGSSLVTVRLDGEELNALVRERQRHVITGDLLHVDLQIVSLTETVRASVMIQYDGESPAVRDTNAILVAGLETLEVEGLPQELPSRIRVDISVLAEWGDTIYVKDLDIPASVEVLHEPDEMVVLVTGQEVVEIEEEEEEEEILVEAEEPELVERGRREEEEDED
jgi:large subunit ribosomal protein L25